MKVCNSRKAYKKAVHLTQHGHEGKAERNPMPNFPGMGIVEKLKSKFGSSKHRTARILRFKARNK